MSRGVAGAKVRLAVVEFLELHGPFKDIGGKAATMAYEQAWRAGLFDYNRTSWDKALRELHDEGVIVRETRKTKTYWLGMA